LLVVDLGAGMLGDQVVQVAACRPQRLHGPGQVPLPGRQAGPAECRRQEPGPAARRRQPEQERRRWDDPGGCGRGVSAAVGAAGSGQDGEIGGNDCLLDLHGSFGNDRGGDRRRGDRVAAAALAGLTWFGVSASVAAALLPMHRKAAAAAEAATRIVLNIK
jgi:hypothetical protein